MLVFYDDNKEKGKLYLFSHLKALLVTIQTKEVTMASKTKDVLVHLMAERGLTQSDIARALSVRPQAVQQWVSGKTRPTGKNLEALAEFLQLPPAVIVHGPAADRLTASTVDLDNGLISIPRFTARGSCGTNLIGNAGDRTIIDMIRLTVAWIRAKAPSANLRHLEIITANGDSMAPTIKNLDFVFVDRTYTDVRGEGIYAVTYCGDTYIKRIQKQVDGSLLLISDNVRYPPITVTKDQLDSVIIEGRCVLYCSAEEL